jgi:tRNA pseudouridine(38-40) synthase
LGDLQLIERDKGTKDLSWHRASRTDKGVHAIRNILVTRLQQKTLSKYRSIQSVCDAVNEKIRYHCERYPIDENCTIKERHLVVHAMRKVSDGFNAIRNCSGRWYLYLIPDSMLYYQNKGKINQIIPRLKKLLNLYKGTHSFHNFAMIEGKAHPNYYRKIYEAGVAERTPVVHLDDNDFIMVKLHGTGFMKHQIRKMMALIVAVLLDLVPESIIKKALSLDCSMNIPLAPGDFLILEHLEFDYVNNRDDNVALWDQAVEEKVNQFRQVILEQVATIERVNKKGEKFCKTLQMNKDEYFQESIRYVEARGKRCHKKKKK